MAAVERTRGRKRASLENCMIDDLVGCFGNW